VLLMLSTGRDLSGWLSNDRFELFDFDEAVDDKPEGWQFLLLVASWPIQLH
jgi:hypothetical protein